MKTTRRRQRQPVPEEKSAAAPITIFSSDLLTPEEERELLADFWENKSELVRVLIRHFPRLRQHRYVAAPVADAFDSVGSCVPDEINEHSPAP